MVIKPMNGALEDKSTSGSDQKMVSDLPAGCSYFGTTKFEGSKIV